MTDNKIWMLLGKNILYVKHLSSSYSLMLVNYVVFFFLTPYTLNKLGEEQYGIWALISSILAYFNLSNLGLNNSFLLELPKCKNDPTKFNKLFNTVFICLLLLSVGTTIIFLILYIGFENLFKIEIGYLDTAKHTFTIVYFIFILTFVCSIFENIIYATNQIHKKNNLE
ncbi:MAG: hypothetical protein H7Z76_13160, partial [Methylotenera sp.]|nr:hypothetical protein [Flavobacterium sp.]